MNTERRPAVSKKLVLDSFALVSLFHKEPGWEKVRAALYEEHKTGTKAFLNGSTGASSSISSSARSARLELLKPSTSWSNSHRTGTNGSRISARSSGDQERACGLLRGCFLHRHSPPSVRNSADKRPRISRGGASDHHPMAINITRS